MRRLLKQRDFLLVWTGGLVSVAGDWVLAVVLPYVVYAVTGSTVATAGMIVAELVPGMLLGSVAGVFVDRWHLGRVLVVGNLAQAAVVALLLLTPGLETLALVYVVAAGQSALAAFTQPAESALLPSLVAAEDLVPANALNVLNNRIGRLLGLPLGAVLYAAFGLPAVVVVDAATFVVAAGLLACVRVPPRTMPQDERVAGAWRAFAHEWVDGIAVVRRDRTIAVLFVVFGLMTFGGTMFDPLTAAWVRDILDGGADVYALLTTAGAVSGTIGALVVGAVGARVPPRVLTGWASVIAGGLLLVRFNVPVLEVAVALSLVQGLFAVASGVGVEALAQQRVPPAYRGRVFGSLQATVWLLSLLGALVGGVLAEAAGLLVALDLAAVLTLLAGVVVLVVLKAPNEPAAGGVEDSSPGDAQD